MLSDLVYRDFSDFVQDWDTLPKTLEDNGILPSLSAYDRKGILKCKNLPIYVLDVEKREFKVHVAAAFDVDLALGIVRKSKEWTREIEAVEQKIQHGYITHEDLKINAEELGMENKKAVLMYKDAASAYEKMDTLIAVLSMNMLFWAARCRAVVDARMKCMTDKQLAGMLKYAQYVVR